MNTTAESLLTRNRRFVPVATTMILFFVAYAYGAVSNTGMRDPQVFLNLFRTTPFFLISAVGMTFVMITGGIDLSVRGVIALTTVASAALLREGTNPWLVIVLMLAMGMLLGAIMGVFITYLKVQPFIATLAGMWFTKGLCFIISDDAIAINDRLFRILGQTRILIPGLADPVTQQGPYISILVVVELLVVVAAIYLAHFTRFGRNVYAIGGNEGRNEISARLMGLPVNRTKMTVYTLNGFCSALAGLSLAIYVASGHGLYARGFELTVIASVVIGGTMLTGGTGYVFGTVFGVLVTAVIQTLIQFNGTLSSWWTNIVVGLLTLVFIGVQSLLMGGRIRRGAGTRGAAAERATGLRRWFAPPLRSRSLLLVAPLAVLLVVAGVLAVGRVQQVAGGSATDTPAAQARCQRQPFREQQAAGLVDSGAVIVYERNGGPTCLDELYAVYADGRIIGDNGQRTLELQVAPEQVDRLLAGIEGRGWFTDTMYDTWHAPCGQCFSYQLAVSCDGRQKAVQAVDGGTDAPADYWQVVSLINGVIPHFDE